MSNFGPRRSLRKPSPKVIEDLKRQTRSPSQNNPLALISDSLRNKNNLEKNTVLPEYQNLQVPASAEEEEPTIGQSNNIEEELTENTTASNPLKSSPSLPKTVTMAPIVQSNQENREALMRTAIMNFLSGKQCLPSEAALNFLVSRHKDIIEDSSAQIKPNEIYLEGYAHGWLGHASVISLQILTDFKTTIDPTISILKSNVEFLRDSKVISLLKEKCTTIPSGIDSTTAPQIPEKPKSRGKEKMEIDEKEEAPQDIPTYSKDEILSYWEGLSTEHREKLARWFAIAMCGKGTKDFWMQPDNQKTLCSILRVSALVTAWFIKEDLGEVAAKAYAISYWNDTWEVKYPDAIIPDS